MLHSNNLSSLAVMDDRHVISCWCDSVTAR